MLSDGDGLIGITIEKYSKGIVVELGLYHSKSSVGVGMLDYKNPLRIIQKILSLLEFRYL